MIWTETDLEIERDKIRLWFVQQMRDKIARSDLSLPDQHCVNISYIYICIELLSLFQTIHLRMRSRLTRIMRNYCVFDGSM